MAPLRVRDKTHYDIASLAETLMHIKASDSNYQELLNKLKSAIGCRTEGLPFLVIAQMFLKEGFNVTFPLEDKKRPTPDISVYCPTTKEQFYIEVSTLEDSDETKGHSRNFNTLMHAFEFQDYWLPYSCQPLQYISDEEMQQILDLIAKFKEEALLEKKVVYYQDEKIRLAISHPDTNAELQNWISENRFDDKIHGHPLNFDETYRISNNKVNRKARQIPTDSSALIYIPANVMYFFVFDFEKAIAVIQHCMPDYPQLLGIVVYGEELSDVKPGTRNLGGSVYSIKTINEPHIRHLLFVLNKEYKGILSTETIAKIYQTLE